MKNTLVTAIYFSSPMSRMGGRGYNFEFYEAPFRNIINLGCNLVVYSHPSEINKIEDYKKNLGPLGGVLSAMKWIKENNKKYKWISTFPSDTPFFKKKHLHDFLNNINEEQSKLFFIKSNLNIWGNNSA